MGKLFAWLKRRLPTQRRWIQLYAALLYNAHLKGWITGDIFVGQSKMLCVPGLNCYSCPGAIGACPLGALQNAIAASGHRAPTYVLGVLLLFGLTLGRTICGFLCPVGLLQELLHKLPTPKLPKGRLTRILSWTKYAILAVFVVALPLWYVLRSLPVPAFCKYICPAGTLEGAVGLMANPANVELFGMLGGLFTHKFILLVIIGAACVFIYRAFCRFLCPLGAIYGLFARIALIGVKVEAPRCIDCGRCVSRCPMDVRAVGDHECIHCGACIDVCPTKAITFRAGKILLHGPEIPMQPEKQRTTRIRRALAWCAALLLLAGVMVYANWPDRAPGVSLPSVTGEIPVGQEVGMLAPDFTVPLVGGGEFTLSAQRGRTVVLNFWATWCGPCCEELPAFDALHRQNGDGVSVLAIHSHLVTDDVAAYLSDYDYRMPFALDKTGSVIASFGGSTMLPMTVVIDEQGVITYNQVAPMTLAELQRLLTD